MSSTYTVSTYQYTDTDGVPGYTVGAAGASLTVTGTGSIVTGGNPSDGVYLEGGYNTLFMNGAISSKHGNGVYVDSGHDTINVNGSVYGYSHGIADSALGDHLSVTIGALGDVSASDGDGINLQEAFAHVSIAGSVSSEFSYGIQITGDEVSLTVTSSGVVHDGIDFDSAYGIVNVAGHVYSDDGAINIANSGDRLTVSGYAGGYSGVGVNGSYDTVRITGTAAGTGASGFAVAISGYVNTVIVSAHGELDGVNIGAAFDQAYSASLTNNGTIDAATAVYFAQSYNSSFVNHGTVTGDISAGVSIALTIDNTGTIDAVGDGIDAFNVTMAIHNSGTIHADLFAQSIVKSGSYLPGITVDNSGHWTATEMSVTNQNFTLVNSGDIHFTAGYGGGLDTNFGIYSYTLDGIITIDNQATGLIDGDAGSHLDIYNANIDNAGTINLPVNFAGTFINEATGTVDGHIQIDYGTVINYGTIVGSVISGPKSPGATFINYGTVDRVVFHSAGDLYNYGTITGHVTGSADSDTMISSGTAAVWFSGLNGNDKEGGGAGNDTIFGGAGNDVVRGNGGNDTIDGGGGLDNITGGTGNDILTGGASADKFIFGTHFGLDTITDFAAGSGAGHDLIHFNAGTFADFASVQAALTVNGDGNVVITLDANDTITLVGVHNTTDLVAQDFGFG
jgi:hypothetical protein